MVTKPGSLAISISRLRQTVSKSSSMPFRTRNRFMAIWMLSTQVVGDWRHVRDEKHRGMRKGASPHLAEMIIIRIYQDRQVRATCIWPVDY